MGTWEYKMIRIAGELIDARSLDESNALGSDGWEAFSVAEDNTGWWVFLKRPTSGGGGRRIPSRKRPAARR